ncbi:nucleopolyhedrovirus P10 family protein [Streptomyces sp. NPDC005263]|uniref:nucleopolyhedrovirus P10 family protein n=1 Tax=Streptomyces sp. NPDC005263 TaxID=3364711 RepID=UPI0036B3892E
MTVDRWTRTVRHQLGLGRLLPLGDARDGAWISESAADAVLRRAAGSMRDVRLGPVRIGLADPEDTDEPVVPSPPSALPPGPLRATAEFAATADEPLPAVAARLRSVLMAAAAGLGLAVAEVDLRVTDLFDAVDDQPKPLPVRPPDPAPAGANGHADVAHAAEAAASVPGVAHLTGILGRPVHIEERRTEPAAALPRRHVRVELAVRADHHRALDVAREVRARVGQAFPDHPTVAVLVTTVR